MKKILFLTVLLFTASLAHADIVIGDGTGTSERYPLDPYYNNSWGQALYLSSDLNAGTITGIKLYQNVAYSGGYNFTTAKVYLKMTTDATLTTSRVTDGTLCFSGSISLPDNTTGWVTITFDDNFSYTGNNLIVVVQHETGDYGSDLDIWATHSSTSNTCTYDSDDDELTTTGTLCSNPFDITFVGLTPPDMAYSSSTTTQNNTDYVLQGSTSQEIIGIEIVTTGSANPINVTSFTVNTTGTTSTSDIENAKLWYTGTSSAFATGTQFGSTNATPGGSYSIIGTQQLSTGTNYFWLTYDIKPGATENNVVDAQCTQITIPGAKATFVPTVTNPAGSRTIRQPLSGTYNIGTTGYDYTTITAAIADLNTLGISGACTFYLRDAAYAEIPMTINTITGASATNTITFKPYSGVSPTITITTGGDAGFDLVGADYITFDGSNNTTSRDMTIVMAGADSRAFQLLDGVGANGATYNTIRNCVIEGYSNTSINNWGIRVNGKYNDNNTFENNEISKNWYGIYLYGNMNDDNTGNVVKDNVIGSGTAANYVTKYGIYVKYQTNLEISGNEVFNIIYSSIPYGLYIENSGNVTISKNNIHDIVYTGTGGYGGYGIYLHLDVVAGGSDITVKNNLIRHIAGDSDVPGFVPTGIRVLGNSSTYGVKLYYNSIYLTPDTSHGLNYENNNWAASVTIDDGPSQIDMRDNILRTSLGEKTGCTNTTYGYAVYCKGSTSPFSTIDNNIYFADNQDNNYVGLVGTDPTTGSKDIAGWQAYTGQDANSLNSNPLYTSTIDLHPSAGSPAFNAGVPIAGITTDYEGETRNVTTPTIGAYELPRHEWTGTVDNNWNTTGNWRSGVVPTAAFNVTIPTGCTNYPVIDITTNSVCNKLTLEPGATITVNGNLIVGD